MLASVGYLLTMLVDCIVVSVTSSAERSVRVQVEEGRTADDKHSEDIGIDSNNPVFFRATSFGDTFLLILALCFHSLLEGIAVGVAGVGIGIAIDATTQGHVDDWIYSISTGLACGFSFMFVINHLIANGFKPQVKCYFDTPSFKFLAVLLGVTVIAVVMIWD
ncbi:E3 ubiquitin-protein ligase RING1-like [Hibiscus syriacus]|uniref:E3 ubiquitin-protein ligase RING1-like n=1 Tax=Hibiscus syriacus TaxID=106335 RepID=A0A6A2Y9A9_HIBSY|nr:E3 ubiquitin-protein ligase RING1-like [Hibiscus syriacus]